MTSAPSTASNKKNAATQNGGQAFGGRRSSLKDRQKIVGRLQDQEGHRRRVFVAVSRRVAPASRGRMKRKLQKLVADVGIPLPPPFAAGVPHRLHRVVMAVEIVVRRLPQRDARPIPLEVPQP